MGKGNGKWEWEREMGTGNVYVMTTGQDKQRSMVRALDRTRDTGRVMPITGENGGNGGNGGMEIMARRLIDRIGNKRLHERERGK